MLRQRIWMLPARERTANFDTPQQRPTKGLPPCTRGDVSNRTSKFFDTYATNEGRNEGNACLGASDRLAEAEQER